MKLFIKKSKKGQNLDSFLSDKQLARRAAQKEESAMEEIFLKYKDRVFSLCLRMAGDFHLAEDLLQDGFLRAFRNMDQYRGESSLGTWLYRVVANTVISRFRQRRQEGESWEEIREESGHVPCSERVGSPQSWQTIDLERAIARLPLGYRLVLVLHDVEGWEHEEIAVLQGCSVGNSKSQLHKARMKMRALLQSGKSGSE